MMARPNAPLIVSALLDWRWLWPLARLALVSAYLVGGVTKLVDFPAAVAEQAHFGLQPAWLWAALAIAVEIIGSALVISGRCVWLGAGALGALTFVAMLTANNFWTMQGPARFMAFNAFFEHLGLISGLVLVSIMASRASAREPV